MVDDESDRSLVRIVSYSLVSDFVRRVYRLVFAEVPNGGGEWGLRMICLE